MSGGTPEPTELEFCGECGAPIGTAAEEIEALTRWYRTKWAIGGAGILAVLVIVGATVAFAVTRGEQTGSSAATSVTTVAIEERWSGAHEHVTQLQSALDDARRALDHADGPGLEAACQQMHDSAGVDLQAHIPTPDPESTSELRAATEDTHAAAQMCLSVAAGSVNSYDGEFLADVDQAERHLTAAQDLVNKALTATA